MGRRRCGSGPPDEKGSTIAVYHRKILKFENPFERFSVDPRDAASTLSRFSLPSAPGQCLGYAWDKVWSAELWGSRGDLSIKSRRPSRFHLDKARRIHKRVNNVKLVGEADQAALMFVPIVLQQPDRTADGSCSLDHDQINHMADGSCSNRRSRGGSVHVGVVGIFGIIGNIGIFGNIGTVGIIGNIEMADRRFACGSTQHIYIPAHLAVGFELRLCHGAFGENHRECAALAVVELQVRQHSPARMLSQSVSARQSHPDWPSWVRRENFRRQAEI
eukprot:1196351-Prorocentrum_minimum.AAC.7